MVKSLENMTQDELGVAMKNAISNWEGLRYKQTCDALGMKPDVPDLYEIGTAEEEYLRTFDKEQKEEIRKVRKKTTNSEYPLFYNDWQRLHINERDYEADCDRKRKSLLRFHKFEKNGKQSILDYSCKQIGYLYVKVLEQAKKSIRQ
jgi:glutamate synthase domain-containing protein 2